jgi:hypothetical protein
MNRRRPPHTQDAGLGFRRWRNRLLAPSLPTPSLPTPRAKESAPQASAAAPTMYPSPILLHPQTLPHAPVPMLPSPVSTSRGPSYLTRQHRRAPLSRSRRATLSQHRSHPCRLATDASPTPPLSSGRSCPTHWSHEPLLGLRLHWNDPSPWISHGLISSLGKPHLPLPFVPQPSNFITTSRSPTIGFPSNRFLSVQSILLGSTQSMSVV